jgi:hypothetical protein
MGGGDVRLLELDEEEGVVRMRLLAPEGAVPQAMEDRVRRILEQVAPEIARVDVDRPAHVRLDRALREGADGTPTPVQLRRAGPPTGSPEAAPESPAMTEAGV